LIDLIGLDDDSFRARFKNSPIKRIKRRGFLRNVAIALGNSADPAAVPPLVKVLDDEEPLIRAHAVWALGELIGQQAIKIIQDKMPNESDPIVLLEIQGIRERGSSTMASD
jgi:epoxyqueuosine reductase